MATTLTFKSPTARLTGWTAAGMLDWPGSISVTLFLSGCEFSCPYCHNPQLRQIATDQNCWNTLLDYIHQRKNWIDGVVISGGEPTSDPEIYFLLKELASYSIPVKLDCNGSNPNVLYKLFADNLVSAIAVDIKTAFDKYGKVTSNPNASDAVKQTVNMVICSGIAHEFRTTAFPELVSLSDFPVIAHELSGAELYVLQQFRPCHTLDPAALMVQPYAATELTHVAIECSKFLPTITRGT